MNTITPDITQQGTCSILLTLKCNLSCPWCIQTKVDYPKDIPDTWSDTHLQLLFEHIVNYPYRKYSILGGEPLLYPDKLFSIYTHVREKIGKDAHLKLFTNGTLLTPQIVDRLNNLNVEVYIALGHKGYKGIDSLYRNSGRDDIVDLIKKLNWKLIKYVFLKKEEFSKGVVELHGLFDTMVSICPDYIGLDTWDDTDIDHINTELSRLSSMGSEYLRYTSFDINGMSRCNCLKKPDPIYPDTIRRHPGFYSEGCIYGCAACRDKLGDRLYNRFIVTLQNHKHNTSKRTRGCGYA